MTTAAFPEDEPLKPPKTIRRRDLHEAVAGGDADLPETKLKPWRVLFDPEQTSTVDFLQVFEIRTDQPEPGRTATGVHYCRFILKPKQRELIEESEKCWARGHAARWRVPKSRGYGVSAGVTAWLGFERVLRIPGWEYTLIAQDNESAEEHLDRLEDFFAQVPPAVLKALGIVRVKSTRRSFIFLHGGRKKSRVTVKTARKKGLGRGGTNNAVHMTERPHWPDKAKEDFSGILGRCYDLPGNVVIDESTAMGHDEFEEDCLAARDGKGGGYKLFFIASHEKEVNYTPVPDAEREEFLASVGTDNRFGAEEENAVRDRVRGYWLKKQKAPEDVALAKALAFLNWRRARIEGDLKHVTIFRREEPTYLEEAFQGYGRLVFPVDVMESHREIAREKQRSARVGMLLYSGGELVFKDSASGPLTIFEFPTAGESYDFGSDVASGQRVHAGRKGEEADYSVAEFGHTLTGRTVAVLRGHIYPKPFSKDVLTVAAWFNGAMGFVENNLPTVVSHLLNDEDEVCGLIGADILLTVEKLMKTDGAVETVRDYGWRTTRSSKPHLASAIIDFMLEVGAAKEGQTFTPYSLVFLEEALRFVYDDHGGMAAESGFDDTVIAHGLRMLARKERMPEVSFSRLRRPTYVDPKLAPFHNMVISGKDGPPEEWKLTRGEDGKAKYVKVTELMRERAFGWRSE